MDIERYDHGRPSWADLSTSDPAAARAFYAGLFGWEVQEGPPETGGYAIAELRGRAVCGIGPQQMPGPSFWSTYVNVDSADDITAAVVANGGAVLVAPMDVMDVGRMAVFMDPAGAAFGVWQPGTHIGAGVMNEPSSLCWFELVTTDVDAAKAFYPAVFGWGADSHGMGGADTYTEWKHGTESIGGLMAKPPTMPAEVPPHWMVYFQVADADAAVARIAELGGIVAMPPTPIEPGRFAVALDPTGAAFSIIELAAMG